MTSAHRNDSARQALMVQKTYREYLDLAKSLLVLSESCSIKEWPDRISELSNTFRLQIMYNDREALRFEYLLRNNHKEVISCRALSTIHERLLEHWNAAEETSLRESDVAYRGVLQAIESLEGKFDSSNLNEPFQSLTRNALYSGARERFAKKIKKLDEQLKRM